METINLPVNHLAALNLATAKKGEVRYNLQAVHVSPNGWMAATNGHLLVRLRFRPFDNIIPARGLLISSAAITDLLKGLSPTKKRNGIVLVEFDPDEQHSTIKLTYNERTVTSSLKFSQYPDVDQFIPAPEKCGNIDGPVILNWEYMALFQKIATLLSGTTKTPTILLDINKSTNSPHRVTSPQLDYFTGVIMPLSV